MTEEQFYTALKDTNTNYSWSSKGGRGVCIRCEQDQLTFCPITAVCYKQTGKVYDTQDYTDAAQMIGLEESFAEEIVCAADSSWNPEDFSASFDVRARLLESLGLEPDPVFVTMKEYDEDD